MNKIIISGRPTKDPEIIRYDAEKDNSIMAKFRIAVKKAYPRGEKTADFFNCVAFGKQAAIVEKYIKQGIKLLLTGHMENNDYEVNGIKVYGYNLVIENIEFLDKKENAAPVTTDENGYMSVPDELMEEMPFR